MKHWHGLVIAGAGVGITVIDSVTAKDATGGIFYGATGILTPINAKLPGGYNVGAYLIVIGLGLWAYSKFK